MNSYTLVKCPRIAKNFSENFMQEIEIKKNQRLKNNNFTLMYKNKNIQKRHFFSFCHKTIF